MNRRFLLGIAVFIILAGFSFLHFSQSEPVVSVDEEEGVIVEEPTFDVAVYTVAQEDTFTTVADQLGISYSDALDIVEAAEDVFDFTSINVGKTFRLLSQEGVPMFLEYEPGTEYMIVVDLQNAFSTSKEVIEYEITVERADVVIEESLFVSGLNAGISEVLLLEYVDIFAWDVDFATQVQQGDTYTILYEKRYRDGEEAGVGDVLYGSFTNVGEVSEAYRFMSEEGGRSYYNSEGESLIREFLRAPLSYSRISSGYTTARFHPVTQTTMPHRAIDYAAPTGTPVYAVADGTVTAARWNGGFGNYVDIRHNSVYETQYAHLSRIAVSAGQSVAQGEIVGYVGSTGWSTGPHLHYQVKVNGTLTNPLEVDFPKGDPLSEDLLGAFEQQKSEIQDFLHVR